VVVRGPSLTRPGAVTDCRSPPTASLSFLPLRPRRSSSHHGTQVCLYPAWRRAQATTRAARLPQWRERKTRTVGRSRLAVWSALSSTPCGTDTRHSRGRGQSPPLAVRPWAGVVGSAVFKQLKGQVLESPQLAHRPPKLVPHLHLVSTNVEVPQGAGHRLECRCHCDLHFVRPPPAR
jgi:hypothetical protein